MRLSIHFELLNNKLPLNYRSSILSFIKHLIKNTDENYYQLLYGQNNIKGFTFSAYIPNSKISGKNYEMKENKFSIYFSFIDPAIFIIFYNAFNSYRNKEYKLDDNSMTLKDIHLINEKNINSDTIKIKFLSPLVLRRHDKETNKDKYISFEDSSFNSELNRSIALMTERLQAQNIADRTIEIIPIKARKTVVPFKEISMTCSFGQFILKGDRMLLSYLYKSGIGSRRSEGFGMFELIQDGENNGE